MEGSDPGFRRNTSEMSEPLRWTLGLEKGYEIRLINSEQRLEFTILKQFEWVSFSHHVSVKLTR